MNDRQKSETEEDVVTAASALALHELLDAPGRAPTTGDTVPPLWHWLAFLPRVAQRSIGSDGHPAPGDLLAKVAVGRRMFASGELAFDAPLVVGRPIRRVTSIAAVEEKTGRSGPLRFVTLHHELGHDGVSRITEDQHLVYRPAVDGRVSEHTAADADADAAWPWEIGIEPDPTLLFRFSALTYNAHRIHYDRTYATEVEGYSGLVVHGPLQAILLAELCRRHAPERTLTAFDFRAVRPAFEGRPLRLVGRPCGDDHVVLAAIDRDGHATMRADARLRPSPR